MQTSDTQIRNNILTASLLIVAGSLVYLFFRPDIILFKWIGISDLLASIKCETDGGGGFLHYFMMYCLSDVLWYSALLILASTFYVRGSVLSKLLFGVMIIMPFLLEFLQLAGLLPGTFDWYDIVFYCLTLIIFVLLWIRKPICLLLHR
ncbi:MAG: hypothetical protein J6W06_00325 [Bacteroidales bacterium]|nr:hypothetical protein [Bacteroidales bacterium]